MPLKDFDQDLVVSLSDAFLVPFAYSVLYIYRERLDFLFLSHRRTFSISVFQIYHNHHMITNSQIRLNTQFLSPASTPQFVTSNPSCSCTTTAPNTYRRRCCCCLSPQPPPCHQTPTTIVVPHCHYPSSK